MRILPVLLLPLLLTACTISPDVVTADQAAGNANAEVAAARRAVARTQAASVTQLAAEYVRENGSTSGFATDLQTFEPGFYAQAKGVTDASISFFISPGVCLIQPLPDGATTEGPC